LRLKDVYQEITTGRIGVINEAGLSRLLSMASKRDFCIATGFRYGNTLQQNRQLNKELNSTLASKRMGGYSLIGHWQEAPDGVEYNDADPETLQDSVEESILFTRPEDMPEKEFIGFCGDIGRKFNQDAVLVGIVSKGAKFNSKGFTLAGEVKEALSIKEDDTDNPQPGIYLVFKDGSMDKIGNNLTIGKVSQAYSQMRNKKVFLLCLKGYFNQRTTWVNRLSRLEI
jgi:hypothetical protein